MLDMNGFTRSEFIKKSKEIHGDKYDYSLVDYKNSRTKVKIICPNHGIFEQKPHSHYYIGQGCSKCNGNKKLTTEEFIEKSNLIHNNKYNYSLVDYKNNSTKIKIICPKHGIFEQRSGDHMSGNGCPKCCKIQLNEFLTKSSKIHNNYYNYELVLNIKNNKQKIKIICPKHGVFEQRVDRHLYGRGCKKCSNLNQFIGSHKFIENSNKKHNYKYDYSLINGKYINQKSKIEIICPIHGIFEQIASNHTKGCGCHSCGKDSNGQKTIRKYLNDNKFSFKEQKNFKNCSYKKYLYFDFYLPEHNICIEFDGVQHFEPIEYFGGEKIFEENKIRDHIKNEYCKNNNIKLIRIIGIGV